MSKLSELTGDQPIHATRRLSATALRWLETGVGAFAVALVACSILLSLMNDNCEQVGALIDEQNVAALKLWANLEYFQNHTGADSKADLPPGLFDDTVEFSRRTVSIINTAHRLSLRHMLSDAYPEEILSKIAPTDGNKNLKFDHLGVDPHANGHSVGTGAGRDAADPNSIVSIGFYQIELYQAIRDFCQARVSFYKGIGAAIRLYLLPIFYVFLGTSLATLRSLNWQASQPQSGPVASLWARYTMALVAGAAMSIFEPLMPNSLLLSPLAIAFLVGYSIDILTSWLDSSIAALKKPR